MTRRTVFELRKARERGHVLEGLAVALANIDEFIETIKASPTPPVAKSALMSKSWDSSMVREMLARVASETRAGTRRVPAGRPLAATSACSPTGCTVSPTSRRSEILQMRLQRLTGLEQDKIVGEYREVMAQIADLLDILATPSRVTTIIADELAALKQEFGQTKLGARRSHIEHNALDLGTEDLITPTDIVVTLSHTGYIKSQPLSEYRAQRRGGRGKQATQNKEDDWVEQLFIANTHDYILCFTTARPRLLAEGVGSAAGLAHLARPADRQHVPAAAGREGQRRAAADRWLPQLPGRPLRVHGDGAGHGQEDERSTSSATRARPASSRSTSIAGDFLIGAALTDGQHDVMLFSDGGKAVRFDEHDVRAMGRNARGVRGMMLDDGQSVIAMLVAEDESQSVLTATENGYGKRTPITEYTRHGRGTKGMIAIQQSERNGKVVAATLVRPEDEIMLITDSGVLVRTRVAEIRELGRATQGVTLIALDDGAKLTGLQRIVENDATVDAAIGNGNGSGNGHEGANGNGHDHGDGADDTPPAGKDDA